MGEGKDIFQGQKIPPSSDRSNQSIGAYVLSAGNTGLKWLQSAMAIVGVIASMGVGWGVLSSRIATLEHLKIDFKNHLKEENLKQSNQYNAIVQLQLKLVGTSYQLEELKRSYDRMADELKEGRRQAQNERSK